MTVIIRTYQCETSLETPSAETIESWPTSMERLSTGLRINSAKDDAAGMAIAAPDGWTDFRPKHVQTERERCDLHGTNRRGCRQKKSRRC
jgi:hypothetical protein